MCTESPLQDDKKGDDRDAIAEAIKTIGESICNALKLVTESNTKASKEISENVKQIVNVLHLNRRDNGAKGKEGASKVSEGKQGRKPALDDQELLESLARERIDWQ